LNQVFIEETLPDEVECVLDKSKQFSTKSLYRFLSHRGVSMPISRDTWKTKLPLKIKVFLWQLSNDKLPTTCNLKKKAWKGDIRCCLCGKAENTNHIFFRCSMAQFIWSCLREMFGWNDSPTSWDDMQGGWMSGKLDTSFKLSIFVFAGVAWAIWKTRNKMAIENIYPANPLEVIYSGIMFVQSWRPRLKGSDQGKVSEILEKMQDWLRHYIPATVHLSDIVEI
jgi:hypothetical protein